MDSELSFLDDFPPPDRGDWEAVRDGQLKGKSYTSLYWRTDDGLILPPVAEPVGGPPPTPLDTGGGFRIAARIFETPAPEIHEWRLALARDFELLRVVPAVGADSDPDSVDYDGLLTGMPRDRLLLESNCLRSTQNALAYCAASGTHIRVAPEFDEYGLGIDGWGRSPAEELALVVSHAIWMVRGCPSPDDAPYRVSSAAGLGSATAARHTALSFFLGTHLLEEIAKLRAARLLWRAVVDAFGVSDPKARRAYVFAESSPDALTRFDQHTNLIRTTLQGVAGVLGGADAISVATLFQPRAYHSKHAGCRWAQNQLRLLRDESFLDRIADPVAGAHAVERLTDGIARRAWTLVQRMEAAGGFAEAYRNEHLGDLLEIEATAERKRHEVATRKRAFVGISRFANPPLEPFDDPSLAEEFESLTTRRRNPALAGLMPSERGAGAFEDLHEIANWDAEDRGRLARVLLLPFGAATGCRPRADFAADLFRAGGFAIDDPHGVAGIPEALAEAARATPALIVVCAHNDDRAGLVPDLVAALRGAGCEAPVYVTGGPITGAEDWGIEAFVHRGLDVLAFLDRAQRLAGMEPVL